MSQENGRERMEEEINSAEFSRIQFNKILDLIAEVLELKGYKEAAEIVRKEKV